MRSPLSRPSSPGAVQCSLCGHVSDTEGKPPRVPTKGGWWAHEECVQSVENVRADGCQR